VDAPTSRVQRRREAIMTQMRLLGGPSFLRQLDDEEPAAAPRSARQTGQ
jgi:hypothetical protein